MPNLVTIKRRPVVPSCVLAPALGDAAGLHVGRRLAEARAALQTFPCQSTLLLQHPQGVSARPFLERIPIGYTRQTFHSNASLQHPQGVPARPR